MMKTLFFCWLISIVTWPVLLLAFCTLRTSLIAISEWPLEKLKQFLREIGNFLFFTAGVGGMQTVSPSAGHTEAIVRITIAVIFVIIGLKIIALSSEE